MCYKEKFENSQIIGCHVDCNKCGMKCRTTNNFNIRNLHDRIADRLQKMWKQMQEDAQFENSQMIGCQVDCNKCKTFICAPSKRLKSIYIKNFYMRPI